MSKPRPLPSIDDDKAVVKCREQLQAARHRLWNCQEQLGEAGHKSPPADAAETALAGGTITLDVVDTRQRDKLRAEQQVLEQAVDLGEQRVVAAEDAARQKIASEIQSQYGALVLELAAAVQAVRRAAKAEQDFRESSGMDALGSASPFTSGVVRPMPLFRSGINEHDDLRRWLQEAVQFDLIDKKYLTE